MLSIILVLILVGLALWGVGQLPLDATIMNIIRAVVVICAVLFVLRGFGLIGRFDSFRFGHL